MRKTLGRENPIVTRSRTALIGGVDELLTRRTAAEISVTDVVEAAGMSRPTFYQHFTDLGSAFAAAGLARLTTMFSQIDPSGPDELADSFADVVRRMEPDAQFYSRVQDSPGGAAFQAGTVELTAAWLRGLPALSTLPADDDQPNRRRGAHAESTRAGEREGRQAVPELDPVDMHSGHRHRSVPGEQPQGADRDRVVGGDLVLGPADRQPGLGPTHQQPRPGQRERHHPKVDERCCSFGELVGRGHLPPSPDVASESMILRCPITKAISIGTVAIAEAAITRP